jgi:hypothetical protein
VGQRYHRPMRRVLLPLAIANIAFAASVAASADARIDSLHIQSKLTVRENVHLSFHGAPLQEGGYYYAVIVLEPYRRYTRKTPPPCSVSSNMQRTNYGYPTSDGEVTLTLTRAYSRASRWCRGGSYEGAIYAVPHSPPCDSTYPCYAEPYEPPELHFPDGRPVLGLVESRGSYSYPDGLPVPEAKGSAIATHFGVRF